MLPTWNAPAMTAVWHTDYVKTRIISVHRHVNNPIKLNHPLVLAYMSVSAMAKAPKLHK